MKIKREILAKLIADIAKIIFATLVVGKFINPAMIGWQIFNIAISVCFILGSIVWFIAPQDQRKENNKCGT